MVDEETLQAMNRTVASRADYWTNELALRLMEDSSAGQPAVDIFKPATPGRSTATNEVARRRRALVDAYIEHESRRTGTRTTRTAIWKSCGYKSRTEFERWERNDPRATKTAQQRFTTLLEKKLPLK
jgi:hypothetical protein